MKKLLLISLFAFLWVGVSAQSNRPSKRWNPFTKRFDYVNSAENIRDNLQSLSGEDRLDAAYIKNIPAGGTTVTVQELGSKSTSFNLDYSSGSVSTMTIAGDVTITIQNLTEGGEGWIEVVQDATGGRTLTIQGDTGYTTELFSGGLSNINNEATKLSLVHFRRSKNNLLIDVIWYE